MARIQSFKAQHVYVGFPTLLVVFIGRMVEEAGQG